MKAQPYMTNDQDTDRIDYNSIMGYLGNLNMFSTQVLSDVIDELAGEIDNRPLPCEVIDEPDPDEMSSAETHAEELRIFNRTSA
jgi:hypothetical protein